MPTPKPLMSPAALSSCERADAAAIELGEAALDAGVAALVARIDVVDHERGRRASGRAAAGCPRTSASRRRSRSRSAARRAGRRPKSRDRSLSGSRGACRPGRPWSRSRSSSRGCWRRKCAEPVLGERVAVPGRGVEVAHAALPRRRRRSPRPAPPGCAPRGRRAGRCRCRAA